MQTFSVPDISCNHCKVSIEQALGALPDAGRITVDLPRHEVTTDGPAKTEAILAALADIGFPATAVAAT
jgi:copper chaperone